MTNLWSFLLQTLTASSMAVLLLLLKVLFKDKLPPSWQFAVWGVLGLVILLPAGLFGRSVLSNWRYYLELLKLKAGDDALIRVRFPFPWISHLPRSLPDWLFVLYVLGVAAHLCWYLSAWLRLRAILRSGRRADRETRIRILDLAEEQDLRVRRIRAIPGLPGAFVCGWLRPVLVIPAEEAPEDTVVLHELLHMRSRDTFWTLVICLLRSLHWCNPLLVWCARRASADLESRCDQRVLERLEGEERREYGNVLLSMAKDRFARTPGATCFFNGARQLRPRIEAIARFKRYPVGMGLASVCVLILLTANLFVGFSGSTALPDFDDTPTRSYAKAVSVGCATADGAVDAYAKSILTGNLYYRTLCAPEEDQPSLQRLALEAPDPWEAWPEESVPTWDTGLDETLDLEYGYRFCAQRHPTKGTWAGLLVFRVESPEDETLNAVGEQAEDETWSDDYGVSIQDPWADNVPDTENKYNWAPIVNRMVYQPIEARREAGRWTVTATGPFAVAELPRGEAIYILDAALGELPGIPGELYRGEIEGLQAELRDWVCLSFCQTEESFGYFRFSEASLDSPLYSTPGYWWTNGVSHGPDRSGVLPPCPGGSFNSVAWCQTLTLTRTVADGPSLWDDDKIDWVNYGEPYEEGGITSGALDMLPELSLPRLEPGASILQTIEPKWYYGTQIQVGNMAELRSAYRLSIMTTKLDNSHSDSYYIELVREGGQP